MTNLPASSITMTAGSYALPARYGATARTAMPAAPTNTIRSQSTIACCAKRESEVPESDGSTVRAYRSVRKSGSSAAAFAAVRAPTSVKDTNFACFICSPRGTRS